MRRPSLRWTGRGTDGSTSPGAGPSTISSSSGHGSSYFTSKAVKRAKKASEDSPVYPSPLSSFWKQTSSEIEESPKGTVTRNTPEAVTSPRSQGPNVQDWNTTRLFDPVPHDSSIEKLGQGPLHINSDWKDWNVTRNYDVKPGTPQQSIDPPRPAREGYEWVWFPAGYWAERELPESLSSPMNLEGRKNEKGNPFWKGSKRKSSDSQYSTSPRGSRRFWGSLSSKVSKQVSGQSFKSSAQGSTISSSKSERFLNKLQSMSPNYPRYVSPSGEPEGLYCKAKRNLSSRRHLAVPFNRKKKPIDTLSLPSSQVAPSTAHTARILEGAVGYFDTFGHQNSIDPATIAPSSSNTSAGSVRRWRLAPWHRRLSDNSISASSSIFELLAGKTPLVTPKSEAYYVGATGKSYMKVEISDPDAPTFLPSEARRVDTPLWSPEPDTRRGFLSNMFPHKQKSPEKQFPGTTRSRPRRDTTRSTLRNLLKTPSLLTPSNHQESSDSEKSPKGKRNPSTITSFKSQDFSKVNSFELNVPDHLPNSPLCPANPKHPSKGRGICPLHGRSRSRGQTPNISRSRTPDGSYRHSAICSREPTPDIEITVSAD